MSTIHVSLDTSADPPVTCSPKNQSMNRGNDSIDWKPAANQSFTFSSLTGLPNPPFSTPIVSDSEITVTDDNQRSGDYPYTLEVMYDGLPYTTTKSTGTGGGDPTIQNK
ncbi:MAG: hypothetical protein KGJ32_09750 [Xanthomonadaceae bacterium]|nr:hypothetical protein [Xanthomonadaceae bacterium]